MNAIATPPARSAETVHAGKRTKVERYKWKVVDAPGRYEEIDKLRLKIDPSYQRSEVSAKILAMANTWSWMACGVILVARRTADYYVFDGQQRTAAALRRIDIKTLPCLVFETEGPAEEAGAFIRANTFRKSVEAIWKFRASVVAGDEKARRLQRLIEEQGCRLTNTGTHTHGVKCIRSLQNAFEANAEVFARIWPLVVEVAGNGPVQQKVFESIFYVETRLDGRGVSLTKEPWRKRLLRLGSPEILIACSKASAFYASGGMKVWGLGLVEALNKGLKDDRRLRLGVEE